MRKVSETIFTKFQLLHLAGKAMEAESVYMSYSRPRSQDAPEGGMGPKQEGPLSILAVSGPLSWFLVALFSIYPLCLFHWEQNSLHTYTLQRGQMMFEIITVGKLLSRMVHYWKQKIIKHIVITGTILNKIALPGFVFFLVRYFHQQVSNKKKQGKQILWLEIW